MLKRSLSIEFPASLQEGRDDDLRISVDSLMPRTRQAARVDPVFERRVEHLHSLGTRAVAEFILELQQRLGSAGWVDERLSRYAALRPDQLRTTGADRFPIHLASLTGGRHA